jgi:hypothetical protein
LDKYSSVEMRDNSADFSQYNPDSNSGGRALSPLSGCARAVMARRQRLVADGGDAIGLF